MNYFYIDIDFDLKSLAQYSENLEKSKKIMASLINTEKLRLWLYGEEFVKQQASRFDTLGKDDIFNSGMNLNEYYGLTRNEKSVLAIRKCKRYLEHKFFQRGVGNEWYWSDGSAMVKRDISRDVSSILCQLFYGSNIKKLLVETTLHRYFSDRKAFEHFVVQLLRQRNVRPEGFCHMIKESKMVG